MRRLSSSALDAFKSCPKQFQFRWVDGRPDQLVTDELIVGQGVHEVLAMLFQLPADRRTLTRARALAEAVYNARTAGVGLKYDIMAAVARYFELEDPAGVSVWATEYKLGTELGPAREFVGVIDRVDDLAGPAVRLVEYKTGRPRKEHWEQLRRYAVLWHQQSGNAKLSAVVELAIFYLGVKAKLQVEPIEADGPDGLNEVHERMDQSCGKIAKTDRFKPKPSKLCGWCAFADECEPGSRKLAELADAGQLKDTAPVWSLSGWQEMRSTAEDFEAEL